MSEDTKENITIIIGMVVAAVISFWVVASLGNASLGNATNKEQPIRIQEITVVDVATGDTLVVHLNKYPYAVKK